MSKGDRGSLSDTAYVLRNIWWVSLNFERAYPHAQDQLIQNLSTKYPDAAHILAGSVGGGALARTPLPAGVLPPGGPPLSGGGEQGKNTFQATGDYRNPPCRGAVL